MRNLIIISILCFLFACSENLEKRIVSTHPNENPAVIEYYQKDSSITFPPKIVRFYINGEKQEETYYNKAGLKQGTHTFWFANGEKMLEEEFDNDVLHGKALYWNENGTKSYEAYFSYGVPTGTWRYFDRDGRLQKEQKFN
ncbi:MAG: hypothetical protein LBR55_07680 [Bacteroidales bacterium]|jgi:hypothetical protein|nr:hypothetical protein [Bacteroidales bacterium]